jgi:Flp pilus assembly pilin Flp
MSESSSAWDQVGEKFTELGQRIKNQFDARSAFGDAEREKVDDALKKLSDALESAFSAIGDTMKDPDIRSQLKDTANTLANAVTTTFHQVADEVKERLGKGDSAKS